MVSMTSTAAGLVARKEGGLKRTGSMISNASTHCPTPGSSWRSMAAEEGEGWSGIEVESEFTAGPPGLAPPGLSPRPLSPSSEPAGELQDLQSDNTRLQLENELLRRQVEEAIAAAAAAKAEASRPSPMPQPYTSMPSAMPYLGMGYPSIPGMHLGGFPGLPIVPGMHGWAQPGLGQPHPWMMPQAPPKRAVATSPPAMPNGGEPTTVMLRNLPNDYTRDMVLSLLDEYGFKGKYDFFYLPIDFKSNAGLGYAFVNLVSAEYVQPFWDALDGFTGWSLPSQKVCNVSWSNPHQGLESHIERFRNSFLMHDDVPDEHKPVLFQDGVRASFPAPTRQLQAPRPRQTRP